MRIYTIGFAGKAAKTSFALLQQAGVEKIIDVRRSNNTLYSAFTRSRDLPFLLERLAGIAYVAAPEFAPSKELLRWYQARLKHDKKDAAAWPEYVRRFQDEIAARPIVDLFRKYSADGDNVCFLCTEPTADRCHRRLLAEYIREHATGTIDIHHL